MTEDGAEEILCRVARLCWQNGQLHILAFAERLLLAINGHEPAFRFRPLYPQKRTRDDLGLRLPNSRAGRWSKLSI